MSQTDTFITTAAAVASYHKELVEAGLDSELIADLVRDAGHHLHIEGLAVRNA